MRTQKHQKRYRTNRLQSRGGVGKKRYIAKSLGVYDKYYDDIFDVWKGFISRNQGKTFFKRIDDLKNTNQVAYYNGLNKLKKKMSDNDIIKHYGQTVFEDMQSSDKKMGKKDRDEILEQIEHKKNVEKLKSLKSNNRSAYDNHVQKIMDQRDSYEDLKNHYGDIANDVFEMILKRDIDENFQVLNESDPEKYLKNIEALYNLIWGGYLIDPNYVLKKYGKKVYGDLLDYKDDQEKDITDTLHGTVEENRHLIEKERNDALKDASRPDYVPGHRGIDLTGDSNHTGEIPILPLFNGGRKKWKTRSARKKSRKYKNVKNHKG